MKDATLIADLVRAGVEADLVGRVVNEIVAGVTMSPNVRDMSGTEYERVRKRDWREANKTGHKSDGKQTMPAAILSRNVPDIVPDTMPHCEVKKGSSEKELQEEKRSKEVVVAGRKKGSRLPADWALSQADRDFGHAWGLSDEDIDRRAAEFIDFWNAVPGQRGSKLDWSATWRNRVRTIGKPLAAPVAQSADDAPKGWRPGLPTHEELKRKYAQNELQRQGGEVLESGVGAQPSPQIGRGDQARNGRMVQLGSLLPSLGIQAVGDDDGGAEPDEDRGVHGPGAMA